MVDDVPKRLSIAEKRALASPLCLTPPNGSKELPVAGLRQPGLDRGGGA